ncbi:hypothetical protein CDAR_478611 [Caerostris darwini]|uniref:Uncharacterized protein n=1 Tax=Caerostris darwini TaxID=1538125 RepID=A0AAV4QQ18_9ARAC|nr:hypothetical protein CDAR_478611 [Caerostris darwini]
MNVLRMVWFKKEIASLELSMRHKESRGIIESIHYGNPWEAEYIQKHPFCIPKVKRSILFPKALKQRTKKGTQFITDFIPKGLTTQISIFVLTWPTLSFALVWSPLLRNQRERTSTPSNNGPATDQFPILDDKTVYSGQFRHTTRVGSPNVIRLLPLA